MNLDHGGHLTHGSPVNFSGKLYTIVPYGVREDTEQIDYDELRRLARERRPRMIQCGATAYSRIIDFAAFREIADEVDAPEPGGKGAHRHDDDAQDVAGPAGRHDPVRRELGQEDR
jgi:hypothetical protein